MSLSAGDMGTRRSSFGSPHAASDDPSSRGGDFPPDGCQIMQTLLVLQTSFMAIDFAIIDLKISELLPNFPIRKYQHREFCERPARPRFMSILPSPNSVNTESSYTFRAGKSNAVS
jgi:hypothetical protein